MLYATFKTKEELTDFIGREIGYVDRHRLFQIVKDVSNGDWVLFYWKRF